MYDIGDPVYWTQPTRAGQETIPEPWEGIVEDVGSKYFVFRRVTASGHRGPRCLACNKLGRVVLPEFGGYVFPKREEAELR